MTRLTFFERLRMKVLEFFIRCFFPSQPFYLHLFILECSQSIVWYGNFPNNFSRTAFDKTGRSVRDLLTSRASDSKEAPHDDIVHYDVVIDDASFEVTLGEKKPRTIN